MKKLVYFALVALFAVGMASCGPKSPGPGEVAKAGVEAMYNGGDFVQYLEPGVSDTLKKKVSENVGMAHALMALAKVQLKEVSVANVEEKGDSAIVELSATVVTDGKEEKTTDKTILKKVDGKWYFRAKDFADM